MAGGTAVAPPPDLAGAAAEFGKSLWDAACSIGVLLKACYTLSFAVAVRTVPFLVPTGVILGRMWRWPRGRTKILILSLIFTLWCLRAFIRSPKFRRAKTNLILKKKRLSQAIVDLSPFVVTSLLVYLPLKVLMPAKQFAWLLSLALVIVPIWNSALALQGVRKSDRRSPPVRKELLPTPDSSPMSANTGTPQKSGGWRVSGPPSPFHFFKSASQGDEKAAASSNKDERRKMQVVLTFSWVALFSWADYFVAQKCLNFLISFLTVIFSPLLPRATSSSLQIAGSIVLNPHEILVHGPLWSSNMWNDRLLDVGSMRYLGVTLVTIFELSHILLILAIHCRWKNVIIPLRRRVVRIMSSVLGRFTGFHYRSRKLRECLSDDEDNTEEHKFQNNGEKHGSFVPSLLPFARLRTLTAFKKFGYFILLFPLILPTFLLKFMIIIIWTIYPSFSCLKALEEWRKQSTKGWLRYFLVRSVWDLMWSVGRARIPLLTFASEMHRIKYLGILFIQIAAADPLVVYHLCTNVVKAISDRRKHLQQIREEEDGPKEDKTNTNNSPASVAGRVQADN